VDLAAHIASDPYLRERLYPEPGDPTYLHLSDLRRALEFFRTDEACCLLDYGCGGSPYRSLFPNADYRRADFLSDPREPLNYLLDESSRVDEEGETFDLILSTQVLEHVPSPATYLSECFRLLKPGGRLYLSTHGSYPDHGCPKDFRRWTADGLAAEIRSAGLVVERIEKQTTGPRAFFFHLDYAYSTLHARSGSAFGVSLSCLRVTYRLLRPWVHRMCDKYFCDYRVVTDYLEAHNTYIVTSCVAYKPD
jgi:SAM-dependent methyltransferase